MKYEDLINWYDQEINWMVRSLADDNSNIMYLSGYYDALRRFFRYQKMQCKDFPSIVNGSRFTYRGITVKVYFDDPGQQMYTIVDGETISGGAYNTRPEWEFSEAIDYAIDKIMLSQIFSKK